jgi:NAD(P)-dependent dehydrogenase (short-subunit alcohol dehydrogenase family)
MVVEKVAVCTDVDEAQAALSAGTVVVLLGAEGADAAALGRAAARLCQLPGSRVAVFVGDPSDPAVLATAADLANEQFGRPRPRPATPNRGRDAPTYRVDVG